MVSNPSVSRVLIRIRCAASSCGATIVAGMKALTLAGMEEEEKGGEGGEGVVATHPLDDSGRDHGAAFLPLLGIGPFCTSLLEVCLAKPHLTRHP